MLSLSFSFFFFFFVWEAVTPPGSLPKNSLEYISYHYHQFFNLPTMKCLHLQAFYTMGEELSNWGAGKTSCLMRLHTTALPSLLLFFPFSPNPGVSVSHPCYSYSCSAAPLPIDTIASLFCQLPSFLMWIMVLGLLDCRLVWLLSLFLLHLQNNELKIQTSRKPKELNLKCHCFGPLPGSSMSSR